jgi:hypothetical protein
MAGHQFGAHERAEIRSRFDEAVNMTAKELEDWLKTPESQEVGWARTTAANPSATNQGGGS